MKELIKAIKSEKEYDEKGINAMCSEDDCNCRCGGWRSNENAGNRSTSLDEEDILF